MVIGYFHIGCAGLRPAKADAPLIVDAYAVLPGSISSQSL